MKTAFYILLLSALSFGPAAWGKGLRVALVSDTHLSVPGSAEALRAVVGDINRDPAIDLVIHLGDVTDKALETEFEAAAAILGGLQKEYYVLPGNHDSRYTDRWEELQSKYFGGTDFCLVRRGVVLAGFPTGPYYPDGNGKEFLREPDLQKLAAAPTHKPVLLFLHHPLQQVKNPQLLTALPQWANVRAEFCGHIHLERQSEWKGIPVLVCRSTLRDANGVVGYTVVTLRRGMITVSARNAADGRETVLWEEKLIK